MDPLTAQINPIERGLEVPMFFAFLSLSSPAFGKRVPSPPPAQDVVATLVGQALVSREAYEELAVLSDDIGHRLAGSVALDRAVAWGVEEMRKDGLSNVRAEPVRVPVWIRGEEKGRVLTPVPRELEVLALGGSVGTPPEGLSAEVLVVGSFDELERRKAEVPGKIVLFDVPFTNYGDTVQYRGRGASAAAAHGAVAALVRSVTPTSLDTPHTGAMYYASDVPQIPAAAITVEAATQIRRQVERGQSVTVHLELGAHTAPDADSANVIGEVPGREKPDEIVVIGCHLDSWDVGQGTQDDGAGCVIVMAAADLINALPVRPRRTVRVVLFTNEENGLMGGKTYALNHAREKHFAALEVDTGAGQPLGFRVSAGSGGDDSAAVEQLRPVVRWLEPIGVTALHVGGGGADIGPIVSTSGCLSVGVEQDLSNYWEIHHTRADTFDKVDPVLLARNVAATAAAAWWLAEQ